MMVEKLGDSRILGSMERSSHRGCHLGGREHFTASCFTVACGQASPRGEDCHVPHSSLV